MSVWLSESEANMSRDYLLSKPNETPFALGNLLLTSVALAPACHIDLPVFGFEAPCLV